MTAGWPVAGYLASWMAGASLAGVRVAGCPVVECLCGCWVDELLGQAGRATGPSEWPVIGVIQKICWGPIRVTSASAVMSSCILGLVCALDLR